MTSTSRPIPVYQTLSPWDLIKPGGDAWQRAFPFNTRFGAWAFSGRVALHEGLASLNLRPASTVLVPNYFQRVEIDTLLHRGLRLRFYRVTPRLEVDLEHVASLLDDEVSVLYVIHYFGWPQRVEELRRFCDAHGLAFVEDCALSLFSRTPEGIWLGESGDLAIYSVYKTLALPHGGYVTGRFPVAAPPQFAPALSTLLQLTDLVHRRVTSWGYGPLNGLLGALSGTARRALSVDREAVVSSGESEWDERTLKYRASRWIPWLMRTVRPDLVVETRRRNYQSLLARLRPFTRAPWDELPEGTCPLFFPILVRDKPHAMEYMAHHGIGTVNLWRDEHPACPPELARAVTPLRRHVLELPIHQDLDSEAVERTADTISRYLSEEAHAVAI